MKEWSDYQVVQNEGVELLRLPLGPSLALEIPLESYSSLGRHSYVGDFFKVEGGTKTQVSFADAVSLTSNFLARHFGTKSENVKTFENRVGLSLQTIEQSLKARGQELDKSIPWTFREAEQGLYVGHSFHPTPKSRDEFSDEDMKRFSPELAGCFLIEWAMVDPSVLYRSHSDSFGPQDWSGDLAKVDLGDEALSQSEFLSLKKKGFVAYPFHPWQRQQLEKSPAMLEYIRSGKCVFVGSSRAPWSPTSSLRSIYQKNARFMLKFSMTLKLTNSIRHLLVHEVERGLQLRDVLNTKKGLEFRSRHPDFEVLTEPAFMCFKDLDGKPTAESVVVCRENPFIDQDDQGKVVLATLTQDAPTKGLGYLQRLVQESVSPKFNGDLKRASRAWFLKYIDTALSPLIDAQANYGVVLGAHQQNLVLGLEEGMPKKAYFRDCQGTGYSELGFKNFSKEVPLIYRENGNVISEKMANYLFSYYLILNSTFNVISSLSKNNWIDEAELLNDLKEFLLRIRNEGVQDSSCLNYLLDGTSLMHKGNFLCSFKNINENTTEDPLVIYTPIPNPIRHMEFSHA